MMKNIYGFYVDKKNSENNREIHFPIIAGKGKIVRILRFIRDWANKYKFDYKHTIIKTPNGKFLRYKDLDINNITCFPQNNVEGIDKKEIIRRFHNLTKDEINTLVPNEDIDNLYQFVVNYHNSKNKYPNTITINWELLGHDVWCYMKEKTRNKNLNVHQFIKNKNIERNELKNLVGSTRDEIHQFLSCLMSEISPYQNEILEILKGNFPNENGEYTDFQAFCICRGHREKKVLYDKYISGNITEQERTEAHQFVKTLNREQILFLMSLPEGAFKCEEFKNIFDDMLEKDFYHLSFDDISTTNGKSILEYRILIEDYICAKKNNELLFIISKEGYIYLSDNIDEQNKNKNKNITSALIATYNKLST